MPKRVFISYRRDDTAAAAGRVYDRLLPLLGQSNVFFDVSTIGGGEVFAKRIVAAIDASDAVLVFIGRRWAELADNNGRPRILDEQDYVRAEVRTALSRDILVIPVLVDGAKMPSAEVLPDDIKGIRSRNARLLRHETFDDDATNIVAAILGIPAGRRPWEDTARPGHQVAYAFGGALAGLVAMVVLAIIHSWALARPLSASIGAAATTLLLIAAALIGALLGLRLSARRRRQRLPAGQP